MTSDMTEEKKFPGGKLSHFLGFTLNYQSFLSLSLNESSSKVTHLLLLISEQL